MPATDRGSSNGAVIQGRDVMWAAGAAICVSYVLSTLPTPLYPVYEQAIHFSQIMLTVIYAVYVVGTVTAMFFSGRLSDQVGRRVVVLIPLGIAAPGAMGPPIADIIFAVFIAVLALFALIVEWRHPRKADRRKQEGRRLQRAGHTS